ncbi:MAG: hypothetical protein ACRC6X_05790 [Culicoidibacterales bacterium]
MNVYKDIEKRKYQNITPKLQELEKRMYISTETINLSVFAYISYLKIVKELGNEFNDLVFLVTIMRYNYIPGVFHYFMLIFFSMECQLFISRRDKHKMFFNVLITHPDILYDLSVEDVLIMLQEAKENNEKGILSDKEYSEYKIKKKHWESIRMDFEDHLPQNNILKLLLSRKYEELIEAVSIKEKIDFLQIRKAIEANQEIVFNGFSEHCELYYYSFVLYLIENKEAIKYHEIACEIWSEMYPHTKGAILLELCHRRQIMLLDPDNDKNNAKYREIRKNKRTRKLLWKDELLRDNI